MISKGELKKVKLLKFPTEKKVTPIDKTFYLDSSHINKINPDNLVYSLEKSGFIFAKYYYINSIILLLWTNNESINSKRWLFMRKIFRAIFILSSLFMSLSFVTTILNTENFDTYINPINPFIFHLRGMSEHKCELLKV